MEFSGPLDKNASETEVLEVLRSTIVQNLSHELRIPPGVILGYSELFHEGEMGELSSSVVGGGADRDIDENQR